MKISTKIPINPNIGYSTATNLENPSLATGIDSKQYNAVINILYLLLDTLFINPNPFANAVVNMAIQRIKA
jgi:hypothetical protein